MSSEWLSLTIGDLVRQGEAVVQTGPFGSQLHSYDYVADGTAVIPTEAIGRGRILNISVPRVNSTKAAELARHRLQLDDILFARRGAQATGLSAIVDKRFEGAMCGTGALLLRVQSSRVDPKYLAMFLANESAYTWLRAHAVGAVMPNLNTEIIKALPIRLPPLEEQRNTARFFNAVDDRIALLRETNATLEAIAQALFKSWFVDFDPVRAKMEGRVPEGMDEATAALFPDGFDESELGAVPMGWRVGTLGDVAHTIKKQLQPSELHSGLHYVGLEHMPRKSLSLTDWGAADGLESAKAGFGSGDILFGKLRPYFHKVVVAPFDGVCSTDILVCQAKKHAYYGFSVMQLFSATLIDYAERLSNGAKMPRVGWKDLADYKTVIPPESVGAEYTRCFEPLLARMKVNIHESQTLASLRDSLLPRLISGQLRLPDAQTAIESATV
jgi:type I restriction enzyme, S subunit